MNLSKQQQRLTIIALVLVGYFMVDKVVITPLWANWKARSERITRLKAQVAEGAVLLRRDAALRDQWKTMQSNVLPAAKPDAESQMLKAFDRWSQNGGVAVSSIRPQWKEAQEDYKTLECRADVSGSLSAITRFLYQIERDPMGVKVDAMELQSRDTEGSQLALVIQVSGLVLNPPKTKK